MEFALFLAQALGRKHADTYTYALLLNAKQKDIHSKFLFARCNQWQMMMRTSVLLYFLLWKTQKLRKWYASLVAVWWQFPPNCHPRSFNESDTKVTLLGWQFQWKWHQSDTLGVAVWCHFSIFIVNTNKTRGGSFIESDTLGVAV